MSSFGTLFRVSTFGESHCKGVGAIVDGCPPCLALTEADIQPQLSRRRPGQSRLTTPREEKDLVTIMSGTEHGHTLGTPIGLFVPNEDQRPGDYKEMSDIPRPGHADLTYLLKYGNKASSGGGRSSARETIGRVAAGAIAEKWLAVTYGTHISCWVSSIGDVSVPESAVPAGEGGAFGWTRAQVDEQGTLRMLRDPASLRVWTERDEPDDAKRKAANIASEIAAEEDFLKLVGVHAGASAAGLKEAGARGVGAATGSEAALKALPCYEDWQGVIYNWQGELVTPSSGFDLAQWRTKELLPLRCPHPPTACRMATLIRQVKLEKDSIGGSVACMCTGVPAGLGEPVFDRLEAKLAHAMMSLPATKGFEIGSGFGGTLMRGSTHNDPFVASGAGRPAHAPALTVSSNNAGGTLGGISSGAPIYFKVAVKSVSTIGQAQQTSTLSGDAITLEAKGRHDPCVLPRTPPLVEGMAALVLIDAALIQRSRLGGAATTVCDGTRNFEPARPWNGGEPAAKKAKH